MYRVLPNSVLKKKSCFLSQNRLLFRLLQQLSFSYYVILTTPSDAESCGEQDGTKQKFVGGMTVKLWLVFCQGVAKNTEKKRK